MDPEERAQLAEKIYYSETYQDEGAAMYRHVILPPELVQYVPSNRLMLEVEWRALGVTQSPGWQHYMLYKPEPHVLLFRKRWC